MEYFIRDRMVALKTAKLKNYVRGKWLSRRFKITSVPRPRKDNATIPVCCTFKSTCAYLLLVLNKLYWTSYRNDELMEEMRQRQEAYEVMRSEMEERSLSAPPEDDMMVCSLLCNLWLEMEKGFKSTRMSECYGKTVTNSSREKAEIKAVISCALELELESVFCD